MVPRACASSPREHGLARALDGHDAGLPRRRRGGRDLRPRRSVLLRELRFAGAMSARRPLEPDARLLRHRRGGRRLGRRGRLHGRGVARAELPRAAERPPADAAAARAGVRRLDGLRGRRAAAARAGPAPPARARARGRHIEAVPNPVGARPPRPAAQLQRRAADRRPVQAVDPGDPEPPERRRRALEAADRLRERPHLRARTAACSGSPTRSSCSRRETSRSAPSSGPSCSSAAASSTRPDGYDSRSRAARYVWLKAYGSSSFSA